MTDLIFVRFYPGVSFERLLCFVVLASHQSLESPAQLMTEKRENAYAAISPDPALVNRDSLSITKVKSSINSKQPIGMEPLILSLALWIS